MGEPPELQFASNPRLNRNNCSFCDENHNTDKAKEQTSQASLPRADCGFSKAVFLGAYNVPIYSNRNNLLETHRFCTFLQGNPHGNWLPSPSQQLRSSIGCGKLRSQQCLCSWGSWLGGSLYFCFSKTPPCNYAQEFQTLFWFCAFEDSIAKLSLQEHFGAFLASGNFKKAIFTAICYKVL